MRKIKKNNSNTNLKPIPEQPRKSFLLAKAQPKTPISKLTLDNIRESDIEINQLLESGVVNLNKPMGPTSHQVSSWVKHMFGVSKVGHGGTLDPRVSGVLPLAFMSGARILNILTYTSKEYVGVMRVHRDLPLSRIKQVCLEFEGDIYQFPPLRSAVKRQLRVRTIYSLEVLENNGRDVLFKVTCAPGTYIRILVRDIGLVLGSGAHMQELRRVRTGVFHEHDSVTLHELKDAFVFWQEEQVETLLRQCIWPKETLLLNLPKIIVQDSAVDALCHGADLAVPGVMEFEESRRTGEPVAMFTQKGEGVAVGLTKMKTEEILDESSGVVAKTTRVLMTPGTYQKGWKTKE